MGIPEMEELWLDLQTQFKAETLDHERKELYIKWGKALKLLAIDPQYPGLNSHTIKELTVRYGMTVWQSYLENSRRGRPKRMFWVYGPSSGEITIIGLEPHPKKNTYKNVGLSKLP